MGRIPPIHPVPGSRKAWRGEVVRGGGVLAGDGGGGRRGWGDSTGNQSAAIAASVGGAGGVVSEHFRPVYVATENGLELADLRDPKIMQAVRLFWTKRRRFLNRKAKRAKRGS
jgi:hypothetical protein